MIPNSPNDTIMAAMFPLRNDGILNSESARSVVLPDRSRWIPHQTNATAESRVKAKIAGIGESSKGHVQEPIFGILPALACHQP